MARLPWLALLLVPSLSNFAAESTTTAPVAIEPPKPVETISNNADAEITQPDPTSVIVAEGRYLYRQRDVDALVQIASRHAKARFSNIEEDRLRQALTAALIAREPLQDALSQLPAGFGAAARDMLVLDLLDYEAEPSKAPTAPPPEANNSATQGTPAPTSAPEAPATDGTGPLLVRLPPLHLSRTLPALGKRHLSMTIALFFRDRVQADKLQGQAPLVQDAILSYIQALPPAQFAEPNQLTLKDGITAAIIAKVPEFPPDAVLIPELDTSAPLADDKPDAKKPDAAK